MNVVALRCVLSGLLLGSCGGQAEPSPRYGDAHSDSESADTLELALRDSNGQPLALDAYRGRRVLLYLFATFDLPSQAAMAPLQEAAEMRRDLTVIGVAMQPNAGELLSMFGHALQIEITLAYEPDNRLLRGLTELGRIEGVPTYVMLDAHGTPQCRYTGVMNTQALLGWCADPDANH